MFKMKAIGIDLGTSKCCVGVVRNGKVEILENERGNRTTPSYVAFTDTERLVGDDAKDQATFNPANSVSGVKRFMCKALNDYAKMIPANAINENGETCFQVTYKKNNQTLLPQQISAMLLTKMKSLAEDKVGSSVEEAVISVPASFSNPQRQATKDAAAIAGLKVLALINEPTAAAIAYQTNRRSKGKETIVVVDFGAGKLEVAVVTVNDGYIHVKGVSGSTDIGGNDVDEMLMSHMIDQYNEKELVDRGKMKLRSSCENIKIQFSLLTKVQETLDCFGEENTLKITMDRDTFEDMFSQKFRKCFFDCLQDSLKVARVHQENISRVLLVGGSSRLLVIQQWLQEHLKCPIDKSINPDEAVAVGASVQAALLSGDHEVNELVVQEAIGVKFHLLPKGGKQPMDIFGGDSLGAVPSEEFPPNSGPNREQTNEVYEEVNGKKGSHVPNSTFSNSIGLQWGVDKCRIFNYYTPVGRNRDESYEMKDIRGNVPGKLGEKKIRKFVEEEEKFRKDDLEEKSRKEERSNLQSVCFRYQYDLQKIKGTESSQESMRRFAEQMEANLDWLNFESSVSVTECRERTKILVNEYNKLVGKIRRHKEQVEKERVAAVTELVKQCLELSFTPKDLQELIVKAAAPNIILSKQECDEYMATLQSKVVAHDNAERAKRTKSSFNDMHREHTSRGVNLKELKVFQVNAVPLLRAELLTLPLPTSLHTFPMRPQTLPPAPGGKHSWTHTTALPVRHVHAHPLAHLQRHVIPSEASLHQPTKNDIHSISTLSHSAPAHQTFF